MNANPQKVVAIILARGGSKGIPKKNIIDFCGKPLITWTIGQLQRTAGVDSIWVSSDNDEILELSHTCNVNIIRRPEKLSGDHATSESSWLHALEVIEAKKGSVDLVLAPQVTSPLREPADLEQGIHDFFEQGCDSLFSCCVFDDLLFWEKSATGSLKSMNYDYCNRQRRQDCTKQYVENGSFYIFKPKTIKNHNNRFGERIGMTEMPVWKMFEIDSLTDLKICEALMKYFLLEKK